MGCNTSRSTRTEMSVKKVRPVSPSPLILIKAESEPQRPRNGLYSETEPIVKKSMTLRLKSLNTSMKVRPPLSGLPAFTVDAIVLSYMGYEDEIFKLLNQLNNNGRLYAVAHASYLKPFLSQYKKEITG